MLDIEEFKKKLDKKSRLIGIDPGKKRIGIAISDENKKVATPYTTIVKKDYSSFLAEIKKIVDENNKEYVSGRIDVCLIDLMTKKPQRFSDDLLLIFK